jgi:3-dehydroquinate dehydratase-2
MPPFLGEVRSEKMSKPQRIRRIQVIHGPNLNLLGTGEPSVYGTVTLSAINERLVALARDNRADLQAFQSNVESEIIDVIHSAGDWADGIVINPGAFGACSYAIADALARIGLPAIEVHISNVHLKEEWRRRLVLAPIVVGYMGGLGWKSYIYAVQAMLELIEERIGRVPAIEID